MFVVVVIAEVGVHVQESARTRTGAGRRLRAIRPPAGSEFRLTAKANAQTLPNSVHPPLRPTAAGREIVLPAPACFRFGVCSASRRQWPCLETPWPFPRPHPGPEIPSGAYADRLGCLETAAPGWAVRPTISRREIVAAL